MSVLFRNALEGVRRYYVGMHTTSGCMRIKQRKKRHSDAGYEKAIEVAKAKGVKIPMMRVDQKKMRLHVKQNAIFGFLLAISLTTFGVDCDFRGQLSIQGTVTTLSDEWDGNAGIQYVPKLSLGRLLPNSHLIDGEISLFGYLRTDEKIASENLRLYRLNARYATTQSEFRLGLQKINFGPAQMLRSLMWFDHLDPTDPMNIADGVWGLRYRYDFLNNANIWLWGMYGNSDPKGYEMFGSVDDKPEFGGRAQTPVPLGEIALTFHSRTANNGADDFHETRYALDGRWDILVGAWFEAVVQYQDIASPAKYTQMLKIGRAHV